MSQKEVSLVVDMANKMLVIAVLVALIALASCNTGTVIKSKGSSGSFEESIIEQSVFAPSGAAATTIEWLNCVDTEQARPAGAREWGKNVSTKGTTTATIRQNGVPKTLVRTDSCKDANTVNEWYCREWNGLQWSINYISCPYGCSDGKCNSQPVVRCGNGVVEGDEVCDDGNTADGDGCSSKCSLENVSYDEFIVNPATSDKQRNMTSVAMAPDGSFVIVWDEVNETSCWYGCMDIFGQRYNRFGQPLGGVFQVNTYTLGDQKYPTVDMDKDGNFVVVWVRVPTRETPNLGGIFGRRYNKDGTPKSDEFQINAIPTNFSYYGTHPTTSVAMASSGEFVVAWDFFGSSLFVRRFSSSGEPLGGDVIVNPIHDLLLRYFGQSFSIDNTDNGVFVVGWLSSSQSYEGDLLIQLYNNNNSLCGVVQPREVNENLRSAGPVSIAMDNGGNYTIGFFSYSPNNPNVSLNISRYDQYGNPIYSKTIISNVPPHYVSVPPHYPEDLGIPMNLGGEFAIIWSGWTTLSDGSLSGRPLFAQRFESDTTPFGDIFQINNANLSRASYVDAAMSDDGTLIVIFRSENRYAPYHARLFPKTN